MLEKTLEKNWRAIIEVSSEEKAKQLSELLWSYDEESFLPHGICGSENDSEQPILISLNHDNANEANVRFFVDNCTPKAKGDYQRLVYMFDGHDSEAVSKARLMWKELSANNNLTYWQQDNAGRWVKKHRN